MFRSEVGRASQSLGHTGSRCHHFLPERLSQVPERFCPRCSSRPNDGGCWQQSEIGHPLPRLRQSGGRTVPRCQHGPQPGSSTRHPGHRAGLHAPPDPYALQRALVLLACQSLPRFFASHSAKPSSEAKGKLRSRVKGNFIYTPPPRHLIVTYPLGL